MLADDLKKRVEIGQFLGQWFDEFYGQGLAKMVKFIK